MCSQGRTSEAMQKEETRSLRKRRSRRVPISCQRERHRDCRRVRTKQAARSAALPVRYLALYCGFMPETLECDVNRIPLHHIPPGLQIVGTPVLILEIVAMFPDIAGQQT